MPEPADRIRFTERLRLEPIGAGHAKDLWRLHQDEAVRSDLWGRGYATEIGRAGLSFAFDELGATEVVTFTEPHNGRSRMVMERLGMVVVGDIVLDGDPFVLYRIRRDVV